MAAYDIQGMKQARGAHWNLGILRGDSEGTNKAILGAKPPIFSCIFPRTPPHDSKNPVSTPGLFHTLDIYTLPYSGHFGEFFGRAVGGSLVGSCREGLGKH